MPMATIHKVGSGELYHIHFLDQHGADPGYGQGRPGGHPDQGLPGGGNYPSQGLPGQGGRPDQGLPGGGHISNRPPGSGGGGIPDHELPDTPPPQVAQGWTLVLVRGPQGRWQYAAMAPGSPPPRPLPPQGGGRPDQGLPPSPDQGLPGGPPPMPSQGLPGQQPHPGGGPMPCQPPTATQPPMPQPQQR